MAATDVGWRIRILEVGTGRAVNTVIPDWGPEHISPPSSSAFGSLCFRLVTCKRKP